MNAWSKGEKVDIRSPKSTRPWQHVLEAVSGYLFLALKLKKNNSDIFSNGGRVLSFVTISSSYKESRNNILKLINSILNCFPLGFLLFLGFYFLMIQHPFHKANHTNFPSAH